MVGLSLLWVVLSLPLVTFGPACAALYHTVTHCVVRQGDSTYLTFFRSFRANLRVGIPAGLLVLAAGALLLQGYQIMVLAANSVGGGALAMYGCYCAALIVPAGVSCWAFPLPVSYTPLDVYKRQGLSGAIAGGADTFLSKNKAKTVDAKLAKWTK